MLEQMADEFTISPMDFIAGSVDWPGFVLAQRPPKHWLAFRTDLFASGLAVWGEFGYSGMADGRVFWLAGAVCPSLG